MRTEWSDARGAHSVIAPVSLIVSAFAPVADARRTLTPQLDLSRALAAAARSISAPARTASADRAGRRYSSGAAASLPISTTRGCCAVAVRGGARAEERGLVARLSRPLGRRPAGDAARDGVCGALRARHRFGRRPAIRSPRALRRSSVRSCKFRRRGVAAARAILERHGLGGALPRHRHASRAASICDCAAMARALCRPRASTCTAAGARCRIACRRCATIRNARARNIRGSSTSTIRGCMPR